ncbi:hypothetical protein [Comamonas sp.]
MATHTATPQDALHSLRTATPALKRTFQLRQAPFPQPNALEHVQPRTDVEGVAGKRRFLPHLVKGKLPPSSLK